MLKYLCLLVFSLISFEIFAQTAWTLETIPNPKTEYNGFVSNPDAIIDAETVAQMNSILQALEDSTTAQVAVVAVNSIGDEIPEDFIIELGEKWGVGQAKSDNGLVILMVMDQHAIEIAVGYGLEAVISDMMAYYIVNENMIPHAKNSDYSQAMLTGVEEINKILIDPAYRSDVAAYSAEFNAPKPWWRKETSSVGVAAFIFIYLIILLVNIGSRKTRLKSSPAYVKKHYSAAYANTKILLLNLLLPAVFFLSQLVIGSLRIFEFGLFIYGFFALLLFEKRLRLNKFIAKENAENEPQIIYNALAKSNRSGWGAAAFFFPLPFLFYAIFNRRKLNLLRNTAPVSEDGITKMIKLTEHDDDEFLKTHQLKEESLKSVDYDVWKDPVTSNVKIYRFENFFSKYDDCPQCKTRTFHLIKNQTIRAASYESSGEGLKTYNCKHCNYTKKQTYSIAKLTRSTSSSSSGGSGSSGGGGGSFGGGGFGGGGGGGRW